MEVPFAVQLGAGGSVVCSCLMAAVTPNGRQLFGGVSTPMPSGTRVLPSVSPLPPAPSDSGVPYPRITWKIGVQDQSLLGPAGGVIEFKRYPLFQRACLRVAVMRMTPGRT